MNIIVAKEAESALQYMKGIRHKLHAMPELSSEEFMTSEFIYNELIALGYKPTKIHTGVYADIKGSLGEQNFAFRADFDALPIVEKTNLPFASKNGCMHACGHDGHTAILLGLARQLKIDQPKNNVRLIFQFGEEGDGGADVMIKAGVLDGIDKIFAFHLCPELEKGKISTNTSTLFSGVTEFNVVIDGKSTHCATKSEGIDAVAAATEFACGIDSCRLDKPHTLIHVGKITAGNARNIVGNNALLECTMRFYQECDRDVMIEQVKKRLTDIDKKYGTTGKFEIQSIYPPLINSADAVEVLKQVAHVEEAQGRYTAEDFAFYAKKISGCMAWLGVMDDKHHSPLHSDTFDFDENVLVVGLNTFNKLANI